MFDRKTAASALLHEFASLAIIVTVAAAMQRLTHRLFTYGTK